MSAEAQAASKRALDDFACDAGRSACVVITSDRGGWRGAVAHDVPRPAASLLKLGVAIATEQALSAGDGLPLAVHVGDVLAADPSPSALRAVSPDMQVGARDVLGLMVTLSDNACARWLAGVVGHQAVCAALAAHGITDVHPAPAEAREGPLRGRCTAAQALDLAIAAADREQHPLTAAAMENVVHAARVPIGVDRGDVRLAHKTGSLPGVAHDVAVLECDGARVHLAFLTEDQRDPLATGYEMGLCTRRILDAWGMSARASRSLTSPLG